ncbi:prolipoprotein diacylglyceryl transferase [Nocardiopsis deserti]|uniref:hypothetical protein n=1 Tax=Nocardiopsis deserti TaxID=2605988 RepID=UPI001680CF56|nr:hypothetical protein [Nocardiopsis deserti]
MTSPTNPTNDPFEEQLRHLLKAEADTVTTSPEALNLIRERTERNRGSAWFGMPWLRPAVAVAGAALIAGSVVISSPQVRDHVLEIVPAGADREGAPTEEGGEDRGVAVPDPSTGSVDGTTQQEEEPPRDPAASPTPKDDEEEPAPSEEGVTATSTCPAPQESASPAPSGSEEDKDEKAASEEGCEPSDEPSSGAGEGPPDEDGGGDSGGGTGGEEPSGGGDGTGGEGGGTGGEGTGTGGTGTTGGDSGAKTAPGS